MQAYLFTLVDTRWKNAGQRLVVVIACTCNEVGDLCFAFKVEPVIRTTVCPSRAVVNAGLWLDDPDVDAITRLCNDIVATEYDAACAALCAAYRLPALTVLSRYTRDSSYVMANGTWCPFNSQNTALHRDLIPAYVLSPLIGRMDDIWARCIPHSSSASSL
jgi:hypothetical protein